MHFGGCFADKATIVWYVKANSTTRLPLEFACCALYVTVQCTIGNLYWASVYIIHNIIYSIIFILRPNNPCSTHWLM